MATFARTIQQLRLYAMGFYSGAAAAQVAAARETLELAKYYCPIEFGTLRASGRVEPVGLTGVEIKFGGPEAPYAVPVHERLEPRHAPPTQAKFLERAVNENMKEFTVRIGEGGFMEGARRAGMR